MRAARILHGILVLLRALACRAACTSFDAAEFARAQAVVRAHQHPTDHPAAGARACGAARFLVFHLWAAEGEQVEKAADRRSGRPGYSVPVPSRFRH